MRRSGHIQEFVAALSLGGALSFTISSTALAAPAPEDAGDPAPAPVEDAASPSTAPEPGAPSERDETESAPVDAEGEGGGAAAGGGAPAVGSAEAGGNAGTGRALATTRGHETDHGREPEEPALCDGYRAGTKAPCLQPPGEKERMADAAVEPGGVKFRPGKGLEVKSADGRFALTTKARVQMLYAYEHDKLTVDDPETDRNDSLSHSLQIRRARVQLGGHTFNEHNKYKVEFAFSPRDMGMSDGVPTRTPILTWGLEFDYLENAVLRVGQDKVFYNRQRVVSSGDLQLVDRSLANAEFNLDRDIGIDLHSKNLGGIDKLKYYAGVYLGEGRDQYEQTDFGLHYLARFEVLPFGDFKDYVEGDHERTRKPRLALGAAFAFNDNAQHNRGVLGSAPSDGGTTDYVNATGDVLFKLSGFSATGEFFWRKGWRTFGDAEVEDEDGNLVPADLEAPRTGIGWHAQLGYLIPRVPLEFAGRYSEVRPIGDAAHSSLSIRDEIDGGLSYYFAGHPIKLQADYTHGWGRDADDLLDRQDDRVRLQLQVSL